MSKRFWWFLSLGSVSCDKDGDGPISLDEATEATVAGTFRARDGTPIRDGRVTIGVEDLEPDPAGMFRFPEQLAGRLVIRSAIDGWTQATAAPTLEIGHTASLALVSSPRATDSRALGTEIVLGGDGLTMTFAPGAFLVDDVVAEGEADFSFYRVSDADPSTPGQRIWLKDDAYEEPIDAFAIVEIPVPKRDDLAMDVVDGAATLRFEVGADWPEAEREDLGLYYFDGSEAYWKKMRNVEVVDGAITSEVPVFGWLAVAAQGAAAGCASGTVARDGVGIFGAEITVAEPGRPGIDRAYTDLAGNFCVEGRPGAEIELSVFGWGPTGDVVGTASATATTAGTGCDEPATCTQLGSLDVQWVGDSDGDVYWPGQGDCDDGDLAINPIDSGDLCIGD